MSDVTVNAAFISIGVLTAALIIALIVAKICDHIYDRTSLRDDASDISEHTRGLIRARLAVMKFVKPKEKTPKEKEERAKETAKQVFRIWSAKSARSRIARKKRAEEENKELDEIETAVRAPSSITFVNEGGKANGGKASKANDSSPGKDKNKQGNLLVVPTVKVNDTSLSPTDGEVKDKPASSSTEPSSTASKTTGTKKAAASSVAPAPVKVTAAADQSKASKEKEQKAKEQEAKEKKAKEEKGKNQKGKDESLKEAAAKGSEGKEGTATGEATTGAIKGGKAGHTAPAPVQSTGEPLKKFEVEKLTGRISPTKSTSSRGTPVKSPQSKTK